MVVKVLCVPQSFFLLWCVEEGDDDPGVGEQLDPYELLPAVNILSQLPADFEENIVCVCACVCVYMCCQCEVTIVLCLLVDNGLKIYYGVVER